MSEKNFWRVRASKVALGVRDTWNKASRSLAASVKGRFGTVANVTGEAYNASLKDNSELSHWLKKHLSKQVATVGSKAMDAEYLRTHIGGGWHRLYDGGHTILGSWNAIAEAFPHASALDQLGTWANEYWKDFITTRGMPIILLDHAEKVGDYFKHLDCINFAQEIGGDLTGLSIWCNWNDPAKLVSSATAADCSGLVYANVVAPLVSVFGLGRAYFLLNKSDQKQLQNLIAPAVKGLTRSGASILLITVVPGGFLIHLSSGVIVSIAHSYVWDKVSENRDEILEALKERLSSLATALEPRKGHRKHA